MKKVFLSSSIIFSLLVPVLASAQLTDIQNILEGYTASDTVLLVVIPAIGVFMVIWGILSRIRLNRKIGAIISIIVTVVLLYMGYLSSLVAYLVPYFSNLGVAGLFAVLSVIFFIMSFRGPAGPMSLTRRIAAKYRAAGRERGKIIGRMGHIDKRLENRQREKSRLESERSKYSLLAEDLSGYIKRGDLPNDVWQQIQNSLGRTFRRPSDALKWLNREVKRRDNDIYTIEMEITRLKSQRTEKSEKLKEAV